MLNRLWILSLWLVYFPVRLAGQTPGRKPVNYIWPAVQRPYMECFMLIPFIGLTEELIKDAQMKLNQANLIQLRYRESITYQLGSASAAIQEIFEHMLEIYKTYADLKNFEDRKYDRLTTLNAYHIIQGDYNKIRLEIELFREIKDKFEKDRKEKRKRNKEKLQKKMKQLDLSSGKEPTPEELEELKELKKEQDKDGRRDAMERLPWKIVTTTTKHKLWKPAPIDYININ